MDSKNPALKQLCAQGHLGQLVLRRKYNIRRFLRSLEIEQLEDLFEVALSSEHFIMLDEYCVKRNLLTSAKGKEKDRLIYLLSSYKKSMIHYLSTEYSSVLLILTWAFVNRVSVEEFMK